jgi:hypothetical protein
MILTCCFFVNSTISQLCWRLQVTYVDFYKHVNGVDLLLTLLTFTMSMGLICCCSHVAVRQSLLLLLHQVWLWTKILWKKSIDWLYYKSTMLTLQVNNVDLYRVNGVDLLLTMLTFTMSMGLICWCSYVAVRQSLLLLLHQVWLWNRFWKKST